MRVFCLHAADDHWQTLRFAGKKPPAVTPWNSIENKPLGAEWTPPQLKPRYPHLPLSDFPVYLGRVLIVSAKAKHVLHDMISPLCEFLPIDCTEQDYIGVNVLRQVDALNRQESQIQWISKPKGLASTIHKFAFRPDGIAEEMIFRIPELPFDLFVSEHFAEVL